MKDKDFYNQESIQYSKKRYTNIAGSYLQFFYMRRLSITKSYIKRVLHIEGRGKKLLEIGCADGVVIRAIEDTFPEAFNMLIGIDTAPNMIREAQRQNTNPRAEFMVRNEYVGGPVDVVVETGVVNYADVEDEILFVHKHLKPNGYYILSVAGVESLYNRLKHDSGMTDFRSYKKYDRYIREKFDVVEMQGCGFFIPYLWKMPLIARAVQYVADRTAGALVPNLCHEKVYLLRKI